MKEREHQSSAQETGLRGSRTFHVFALLLIGGVLFFLNLSGTSLVDNEETRFALQARQMVETGDWLVPRWSGRPLGTKPPLFHWTIGLLSVASGEVSEWTARIPSAAAALATLFLVYALGSILFGRKTGFLSALVLSTTFIFFQHARMARSDMLLTFFITLSVYLFVAGSLRAESKARLGYLLGAYGAAALATLTKGPVGIVLAVFGGLAFLGAKRKWGAFPVWGHLLGVAFFAAVATPWYVLYAQAVGREYVEGLLIRENLTRYVNAFNHPQPIYYYVEHFSTNLLPWSLLGLPALVYAWKRRRESGSGFLLLWWAAIFIFFSLSTSKRDHYILPLYPAAALLTGAFLGTELLVGQGIGWRWMARLIFQGMMVALVVGSVGLAPVAWYMDRELFQAALILGAIGLVTGLLALWAVRRGEYGWGIGISLAGLLLLQVAGQWKATPIIEARRSPAPSAVALAQVVGDRPLLAFHFTKASIDLYGGEERKGKVFYAQRFSEVASFLDEYPQDGYVLMKANAFPEFWEELKKRLRVVQPSLSYGKFQMILLENIPSDPTLGSDPDAQGN